MSILSTPSDNLGSTPRVDFHTSRYYGDRTANHRTGLTTAALRGAVLSGLRNLVGGHITIIDGQSRLEFGDRDAELRVNIYVHDPRFYRAVALGGSIGAGESYRDGYWSCDNLTKLIQVFARNLKESEDVGGLLNGLLDVGRRMLHRLNRNTPAGSRRNIAAHYDLSNEFYSLFLDETMTYSSGVFPADHSSMREASLEKYDRICRKLQLSPDDEVLEIGTGWGGFAVHAVEHYGCRVTTTTISAAQHEYAHQLFASRGIADRVRLLRSDYRDLRGKFDKLVSIEMIEAVGHEYFETYFAKCSSLLKPDGLFALQTITMPDHRFRRYLKSVDFIQRYIFPGGCLTSIGAMSAALGKVTDLQLAHLEDFAEHYARTLACWREKFHRNIGAMRELGMSDSFLRLWEYYLCYCEGAFREKQIGVSQLLLQKPGNRRRPSFLVPGPTTRE